MQRDGKSTSFDNNRMQIDCQTSAYACNGGWLSDALAYGLRWACIMHGQRFLCLAAGWRVLGLHSIPSALLVLPSGLLTASAMLPSLIDWEMGLALYGALPLLVPPCCLPELRCTPPGQLWRCMHDTALHAWCPASPCLQQPAGSREQLWLHCGELRLVDHLMRSQGVPHREPVPLLQADQHQQVSGQGQGGGLLINAQCLL